MLLNAERNGPYANCLNSVNRFLRSVTAKSLAWLLCTKTLRVTASGHKADQLLTCPWELYFFSGGGWALTVVLFLGMSNRFEEYDADSDDKLNFDLTMNQ
jgi:hypothetical protein